MYDIDGNISRSIRYFVLMYLEDYFKNGEYYINLNDICSVYLELTNGCCRLLHFTFKITIGNLPPFP